MDGSVDPPTAPIQWSGDLYLFTADIYDSIVIQKDNVVVDGNGFKLQGASAGTGFTIQNMNNVSIINAKIIGFATGVYVLLGSAHLEVSTLTNNGIGIEIVDSSSCTITGSNVSYNTNIGIYFSSAVTDSVVSGNSIEYNGIGMAAIPMLGISGNNITENTMAHNSIGFKIDNSAGVVADNFIYHNNFVDNAQQIHYTPVLPGSYYFSSIWDNGYPSGGNFWSDYTGVDLYSGPMQDIPGSDGIGDTPYVITPKDIDHYPLMAPYVTAGYFVLQITATAGGTTNPAPGSHIYALNEVATVEALPETTYLLDYWELDGFNAGASNPISITMNSNHALLAVFRTKPDIAVIDVSSSPTSVRRGQPVNVYVTIQNQGSLAETFDVIVYADKDRTAIGDEIVVGIQTVYDLPAGGTKTVYIIWDTTGQATGSYYISAKAIVANDIDPSDNILTAKRKVAIKR